MILFHAEKALDPGQLKVNRQCPRRPRGWVVTLTRGRSGTADKPPGPHGTESVIIDSAVTKAPLGTKIFLHSGTICSGS
mgnify:CR=1 FL=1